MKWILLSLLFFISSLSFAESVLVKEEEINMVLGEEFILQKPTLTVYSLGTNNQNALETTKINEGWLIKPKTIGKRQLQAIHFDGTMTLYTFIIVNKKNIQKYGNNEKRGYFFSLNLGQNSFKKNDDPAIDSQLGSLKLKTTIGSDWFFQTDVNYASDAKTTQYSRIDYKKIYYGYGEKGLQSNPYGFSLISKPLITQHTFGYNSDVFDLDLWKGTLFDNGTTKYQKQDELTGFKTKYQYNERLATYFSWWENQTNGNSVPYVGLGYNNSKFKNDFAIGNDLNDIVLSNSFQYYIQNEKFGLQDLKVNYEYAPNGYKDLFFNSKLPYENLGLNFALKHDESQYQEKGGGFFSRFGYNYSLHGFKTNNQYSTNVGWYNTRLNVQAEYAFGETENAFQKTNLSNSTITPSIYYWLNEKGSEWRYRLGTKQKFSEREDVSSQKIKRQESVVELTAKNIDGLNLSLGLGRTSFEKNSKVQDGFLIAPRIEYNSKKIMLGASGSLNYVNGKTQDDPSYSLGQERFAVNGKYKINDNHLLSAKVSRVNDVVTNRDATNSYVGYTYTIGSSDKGIIPSFNSMKVVGTIYEDLNFNKIKDSNEIFLKDIKISLISIDGKYEKIYQAKTNNEGYFEFSGLEEGKYSLSAGSDNYTIQNPPPIVNLEEKNYYSFELSAIEMYNSTVEIKGSAEGMFANIVCSKKGQFSYPVLGNYVNNISIPKKDKCKINLDALASRSVSFYPGEAEIVENKVVSFEVDNSINFIGQVFVDYNNNNSFDIGEEAKGAIVVFDAFKAKTDENGVFSYAFQQQPESVKFLNVTSKKCSPMFVNPVENFQNTKIQQIKCSRK